MDSCLLYTEGNYNNDHNRKIKQQHRTTATEIEHMIADAILEIIMHPGMIKANISNYFPTFII